MKSQELQRLQSLQRLKDEATVVGGGGAEGTSGQRRADYLKGCLSKNGGTSGQRRAD